jgi:hypothetical protein
VSQSSRAFPELALRLDRFTVSTRASLSRALVRALQGHRRDSPSTLNDAVRAGCRELRVAGADDQAIMEFFAGLVEDTGRACGADRPSLMSGEPRWVPVRARVLELVGDALPALEPMPAHTSMLAMDHPNGPR